MGDFFDGGAKLNGKTQTQYAEEAVFGTLSAEEQNFVTSFNPTSLLFYFGIFGCIIIFAWVYMILRCKEKTTPAMDTCAKWTGGILFFAFCAFIIFSIVYLIVGNKLVFRKNALEEYKGNLKEIVEFCKDHPDATKVKGATKSVSNCKDEREKYEDLLRNEK